MKFLTTALVMFLFWVLLSGYFDAFHIVTGILSSLLVAYMSHDLLFGPGERVGAEARRLWNFARYLPWLLYEILKANLDLVYRTLHPGMPIDPRLVRFRLDVREDKGIATLANSITLTPGTVTIGVDDEGWFTVHAISEEAAKALLEGEMQRRVSGIGSGDV